LTRWRYAAGTDTGLVRSANQDALFVDDRLAIVADGMGGHAAGEIASALTVETVVEAFASTPTLDGMLEAITEANRRVVADAAATPERFGMGTTIVAVAATREASGATTATLFNVGDSRAYQLRDGALRQLSVDHSVAEEWVRMGRLTPEEAMMHPQRHQLTRAVGVEAVVEIDVLSLDVQPGDRLLLCSDGLSNELSGAALAELASAPVALVDAVDHLIAAAKAAGGRDNISVVVLEFDETAPAQHPIDRTMTATPPPVEAAPEVVAATPRRRSFTWRSAVAALVLVGVAGGFYGIMHWYAYSTYYLGVDGTNVALYQGQPGGVLWFKPTVVTVTGYQLSQLRSADAAAIRATVTEPTEAAALSYVNYLHSEWSMSQVTTTTTTPKKKAT
jgi:protein phosphatase